MWNWTRRAAEFLSWEAVQIWVLPSLSIPATVIIGWFSSISWFYVWLGAGFMFAVVSTGLLRFHEWRTRITAEYKLSYDEILVRKTLLQDGISVSMVGLGFLLRSTATFPIRFEVQNIETQVANLVPRRGQNNTTGSEIPPNGVGWFNDPQIDIRNQSWSGTTVEGIVRARVKYGRPGNLCHELEFGKRAYLRFEPNGNVLITETYDL